MLSDFYSNLENAGSPGNLKPPEQGIAYIIPLPVEASGN